MICDLCGEHHAPWVRTVGDTCPPRTTVRFCDEKETTMTDHPDTLRTATRLARMALAEHDAAEREREPWREEVARRIARECYRSPNLDLDAPALAWAIWSVAEPCDLAPGDDRPIILGAYRTNKWTALRAALAALPTNMRVAAEADEVADLRARLAAAEERASRLAAECRAWRECERTAHRYIGGLAREAKYAAATAARQNARAAVDAAGDLPGEED